MGIKKLNNNQKPHGKNRSTDERRRIKATRVRNHGHYRGNSEPREFYVGSHRWVEAAPIALVIDLRDEQLPGPRGPLVPRTANGLPSKPTTAISSQPVQSGQPRHRVGRSTPFDGFWATFDPGYDATHQMMTSGTRCF